MPSQTYEKDIKHLFKSFFDNDHIEEVPSDKVECAPDQCYYLPHHCVFKEDSTTTKLRVVFDGSAKTTNGISINEAMMVGPVVQDDLFSIITRFRFYKVALSADIEKMYSQVGLKEDHRDFHRLLWRNTSQDPLKHLRLTRIIYGVSCSAHLSTRCLTETANRTQKPHVAHALRHAFYVDDFLGGAHSLEEAQHLIQDLRDELSNYGFPLRKWSSSDPVLIKNLPAHLRAENDDLKLFAEDYKVKALGVFWQPNLDQFVFKCSLEESEELTKRNLLSSTSKLFDPLGWLTPIIIQFKILMQQTWVRGLDWDQPLPDDIKKTWTNLRAGLSVIQGIKIPRAVIAGNLAMLQLHVFCDASAKAYAAVIYSRASDQLGHVTVSILSSKTRVAPVKTVSLPRLELCGAEVAAKLASSMTRILQVVQHEITLHAWTDSTIVLQWIAQLPRTWSTFVANRVAKIQEVLPRSRWRHVPSLENPADLASRGCSASHLAQSNLWWTGPHWLHDDQSSWPDTAPQEEEPLERRTNIHVLTVVKEPDNKLISVEGFNDIRKVFRIVAYVIHFVQRLQRKTRTDQLHPDKVNQAKFHVLRIDQQENFPTEYKQLKEKQSLLKKNQLQNLAPFFDPDYNVIRVGGRVSKSLYSESKKFPLLVSKNSKLVNLIIRQFHEASLHGGGQLTLNLIRQEYWITQAKPLVNNFIKHCLTCFRFNTYPPVQLMGDLPTERITPSRPFTHTGLDFAGHFWVKIAAADEIKEVKYYIAVFVCLSTKAVHLESVASLTKEDCIFALNRFIARRGMPSKILSDNGTNFLGARSDLIKIEALLNKDDKNHSIISFVTEKNCEWITIPPRAPHFGGLWEAAVKSISDVLWEHKYCNSTNSRQSWHKSKQS